MNEMLAAPSDRTEEVQSSDVAGPADDERALRVGAYGLLAALLRTPPDEALLVTLRRHDVPEQRREDAAATALRLLGLAARDTNSERLADEFHLLFVGLGRGELVPYGSWYLTGFLMEKPLSLLRDDLRRLGFERQADVHEPEDHVAALCEVMALLIQDSTPIDTQQNFYRQHLEPWVSRFFRDLENAESACFYRAVGRFGKAFAELESRYLSMRL
jgi:TorA maturation chaperone TorD